MRRFSEIAMRAEALALVKVQEMVGGMVAGLVVEKVDSGFPLVALQGWSTKPQALKRQEQPLIHKSPLVS